MSLADELEALRGEREQLRKQIDQLPAEYQRRLADMNHKLIDLFARMSGVDLASQEPDPPGGNIIPFPRKRN